MATLFYIRAEQFFSILSSSVLLLIYLLERAACCRVGENWSIEVSTIIVLANTRNHYFTWIYLSA